MDNNKEKNTFDNRSMHSSTFNPPSHHFMTMSPISVHGHRQVRKATRPCFANQLKQTIHNFWKDRQAKICSDVPGQQMLPLARIKKVMKSVKEVKMISADTPVVFAKVCEMFIMELTLRAWMHSEKNKRRTIQRCDVAHAIRDDNLLKFLHNIVPMETHQMAQLEMVNQDEVFKPLPESVATSTYPSYMELTPPSGLQITTGPQLLYPMNQELAPPPEFQVATDPHLTYSMNQELAPPHVFQVATDPHMTYPMNQELAPPPPHVFQVATDPHLTYPMNQELAPPPPPPPPPPVFHVANDPHLTYPMNQESTTPPSPVFQVGNDPHSTYPMNSYNYYDIFMENQEMLQGQGYPWFPPPPPSSDGSNHYPGFEDIFMENQEMLQGQGYPWFPPPPSSDGSNHYPGFE